MWKWKVANLSFDLLQPRPFHANSSTSGKGHRGNTRSKSEIIMQTALRGLLMTKVSLRCSCGSALECQLGTLRDVELGDSDWHSKHLQFLCGHVHSAACASWCEAPWNILQWECGWRQVMQEGEFHCHAFPKEKKSLNLGGASCSISSRNLQLVPREPSHMCVALFQRAVFLLSFFSLIYIFHTSQQGLLIRFWHCRDTEHVEIITHLCVILFKEMASSKAVFWTHTHTKAGTIKEAH